MAELVAMLTSPAVALGLAFVALGAAALQLALCTWRDVGSVTIVLLAAAVVASNGAVTPPLAGVIAASLVLAAIAWVWGGRRGVGRPGLLGVALGVGGLTLLARWSLPLVVLGAPPEQWTGVLLAPCAVAAAVCFAVALERPGPRRIRPRWYRNVPVERPESAETSGAA